MILALAKVMIAAAWADGAITNEELNSLKDLLFSLPGMAARDWAELEIYIENPVETEERTRLVEELQQALSNRKDRDLAIAALRDLVQADGAISEREQSVFETVRSALENVNPGIFGLAGRLIQGPVQRRTEAAAAAPNREVFLEDFIRNKVYFNLRQRLQKSDLRLDLPDPVLRKLSLSGGLMAYVAYIDREVTEGEFDQMVAAIQPSLGLDREQASFVAEVAVSTISKNLDFYRLMREFFEATTEEERVHFLDALFAVAAADGSVSHEEMEEIQRISKILKLTHQQYIEAKLSIPRDRRAY
jgi:uncharacterized tellurite resistance protein B-like protein